MPSVCFYLHLHQPERLSKFSFFDIGQNKPYFDDEKNKFYLERVVRKSYLPTNKILLDLIKETKGKFKVSFSITGTLIDQLERDFPEVINSFRELVKTGSVDILSETYYHSLAYLYSKEEFKKQVKIHNKKIKELFNYTPKVFRNTELIFNNEMAKFIQEMGYKGILAEGADHILGWRSPNFLYRAKTANKIKLLLKNYRLSDDIAFRFSNQNWTEWPLRADKYASWVNQINGNGEVVNLFMDYETFGEHQWESTGIFDFLRTLPYEILKHPDNNFLTVSEVVKKYKPVAELDYHNIVSWADLERDLSAWLGNKMQKSSMEKIYNLEKEVLATKSEKIIKDWRRLQTSDHFYYMCTKWFSDGDVHKYFNPYESPYDSFIFFMNIINDLKFKIGNC
jgi:alpha-amylase